jgi:ribosomal protein L37E
VKDAAAREERAQARKHRDECRRCGAPLDDADDATCAKCQFDDWHEENFPQEDGDER